MKAFLLAAGLGTRLRPITDNVPKCLLPVNGKPLLAIWLDLFKKHGIDDILINTHWLESKVEDFLKQSAPKNIRVTTFHEPVLLGTAGTLLANRGWVSDGEPFFIVYGDNLTNIDLTKMVSFHRCNSVLFTMGVFKTGNPRGCGIVEIGPEGLITGFVEKPREPKSDLAAAGIYITDKRIFDHFAEENRPDSGVPYDLGWHILPSILGNMKAYLIRELFIDIGTMESYDKAQELWRRSAADRQG